LSWLLLLLLLLSAVGVQVCASPLTACPLMDGLLVTMVACFVVGVAWLYATRALVDDLQSARNDAWNVDSLADAPPQPPPRRRSQPTWPSRAVAAARSSSRGRRRQ